MCFVTTTTAEEKEEELGSSTAKATVLNGTVSISKYLIVSRVIVKPATAAGLKIGQSNVGGIPSTLLGMMLSQL